MSGLKKVCKKVVDLVPVGGAIGLARIGSNVYGSMNPMLALIFLSGQRMGKFAGVIVGIVSTLVSSIYCGYGPWVIMQIVLWTLAGFIGGCMKDKARSTQFICAYGFMFGVIMDVYSFYITPMGYPNVLAQVIGGIPFDLRYCVVSTGFLVGFYAVEFILKQMGAFAIKKLQPIFAKN